MCFPWCSRGYAVDMSSDSLEGYLTDHLGGAAVALELIDKLRSKEQGSPFGVFLDELKPAVEADRERLEGVMEELGVSPSLAKQAGGWLAEKVTRIRLDEHVTGSEALSRLLETELLSLGIEGKRLAALALKRSPDQTFHRAADELAARAADQRSRLEPFRIAAAERVLAERGA